MVRPVIINYENIQFTELQKLGNNIIIVRILVVLHIIKSTKFRYCLVATSIYFGFSRVSLKEFPSRNERGFLGSKHCSLDLYPEEVRKYSPTFSFLLPALPLCTLPLFLQYIWFPEEALQQEAS